MGRYLVELYLSPGEAADLDAATARAQSAADEASSDGAQISCLRSIFVPEDETWFLLYEAPTAAAVRHAVDCAALPCARIVEAVAPR
jgi:hypothetical protein